MIKSINLMRAELQQDQAQANDGYNAYIPITTNVVGAVVVVVVGDVVVVVVVAITKEGPSVAPTEEHIDTHTWQLCAHQQ